MRIEKIELKNKLNEDTFAMFGGGGDPTAGASYTSPSQMVQGQVGYVYAIHPFTDALQQKPNKYDGKRYISVGSKVTGYGLDDESKKYTGYVVSIPKNEDGSIFCVNIRTIKEAKMVSLSTEGLKLIIHKDVVPFGKYTIQPSNNMALR